MPIIQFGTREMTTKQVYRAGGPTVSWTLGEDSINHLATICSHSDRGAVMIMQLSGYQSQFRLCVHQSLEYLAIHFPPGCSYQRRWLLDSGKGLQDSFLLCTCGILQGPSWYLATSSVPHLKTSSVQKLAV